MSATPKASRAWTALGVSGWLLLGFAFPGEPEPVPREASRASTPVATRSAQAAQRDCMECHEELWDEIEGDVPHAPALAEECGLCHSPHAARFENLLHVRERALCAKCHADEVAAYTAGSVHTPVREGSCVACHEVHGSANDGLLVEAGNALCFRCHEEKHAQTTLAIVHEPFVEGECSDCHEPHNSPHPDQLLGPANAMCSLCHGDGERLLEAHADIPVEGTRCTSCHDAHASRSDGLLLPIVHEPFADGSCEMCHATDGANPRLLRATGQRLCQVCHRDYPRTKDDFVHAPIADGNCGACHLPHASKTNGLLPAGVRETCNACHADLEERARASKSAHPMSMEEGSCTACHQPHSSTQEHLLSAGAIRTCLPCHETQRHGHPLGEDRIDPRTGKGITCVTCHDPHGTDYSMQLRGDQSRGLCLGCHSTDHDDGSR
jgi:predicted CXXCH cytochrome family protein